LTLTSIEAISAKTGISKFYQEFPAEVLLRAFFTGIFFHFDQEGDAIDPDEPVRDQPLWNDLLQSDNCRIVFRSANPIGASDGLPTRYLCFELDASTPVVHAYPISEHQANLIRGNCSAILIDDLVS
jgi:hypothetical protein